MNTDLKYYNSFKSFLLMRIVNKILSIICFWEEPFITKSCNCRVSGLQESYFKEGMCIWVYRFCLFRPSSFAVFLYMEMKYSGWHVCNMNNQPAGPETVGQWNIEHGQVAAGPSNRIWLQTDMYGDKCYF